MELALTHKSWVNEHKGIRRSNERLEFLGDAILEYVVSSYLYNKFPNEEEGYLTAFRAKLVNTVSLSKVAESLNVGKYIYLSKGEEDGGGRSNQSLLADTIEAIIGSLFIDGGVEKAGEFINANILSKMADIEKLPLKDSKSAFQEIVQSKGLPAPKYQVVKEEGPDHAKQFTIEVVVDNKAIAKGTGKNKSEAAQSAAEAALAKFL